MTVVIFLVGFATGVASILFGSSRSKKTSKLNKKHVRNTRWDN